MHHELYLHVAFFFIYSFLGWVTEEIFAAFKYGRFINRGFLNGPMCPVYGISMFVIFNVLSDYSLQPFWQLIGAIGIVTVIEYVTGALLRKITGRRFWDYRDMPYNLDGYICLRYSIVWGMLAAVALWLVQPAIYILLLILPKRAVKLTLWVVGTVFFLDLGVTLAASLHLNLKGGMAENVVNQANQVRKHMGRRIFMAVQRRMYTSFPELKSQEPSEEKGFGRVDGRVFAKGLCLEKLIWMFFISGVAGDIVETIYMWGTTGQIMSRSSFLYIPFSIVWGAGGALGIGLLYSVKRSKIRVFLGGFFFGGVFEYTCSVLAEFLFGTTFWDYSRIPFNLNGRINLLFCGFWGIAALILIYLIYPVVSRWIEKIPLISGTILTWALMAIMVLTALTSSMAITRYVQRQASIPPKSVVGEFLDVQYPDTMVESVYPYMKIVK